MRRKTLLALLLACSALATLRSSSWAALAQSLKSPLPRYTYDVWTTEQGLPQNSVTAIVQTRDGYLWLGTQGGLARFDGIKFTVLDETNTPAIGRDFILALVEDGDGVLWIATERRGLIRYSPGEVKAYTSQEGLPNYRISSMCVSRDGGLWIGTFEGLVRFKDGKFTTYTTAHGLSAMGIFAVYEDAAGNLWIGTERGGLNRLAGGQFTHYTVKDGLPAGAVNAVCEGQDGSLWVGTSTGLAQLKGEAWTTHTTAQGLSNNDVRSLLPDRQSGLWVGTFGGGLSHLVAGRWTTYTLKDRLSGKNLRCLYQGREGSLWLGAGVDGLYRLKPEKLLDYSDDPSLPRAGVVPITEDQAGHLYLGYGQGSIFRFRDGAFSALLVGNAEPSHAIWALCADRDGALWFGTAGSGLKRLKDGALTTYTTASSGLLHNFVSAIHQDRQGALWVGTHGGLNRFKDGAVTAYGVKDGLVHEDVRFIMEDRQGALWLGTMGGLSRFKDGRFTSYTTAQGLSHNIVRAVYEDADGVLWIGTYGGGLNRLKDGRFIHITIRDGLFDNTISRIIEDDRGNFWMSSNRGVFRVSRRELNDFAEGKTRVVTAVSYGTADGMKTSECNGGGQPAGYLTRDRQLWFPTVKGVVAIDLKEINLIPPPMVIEQVIADHRPLDLHRAEAAPGQGDLEIAYTALSLAGAEKAQFKYRLEGYETDWVDAGTRRVAYYTNLPPGRYRFRVIGCNNDGVWNETGAVQEFYLAPHFYQTKIFYALVALALGLIGGAVAMGAHRWRVKQLLRRAQELEAKVDERTAEVVKQQEETVRQKDLLAQAKDELEQANDDLLSVLDQLRLGVLIAEPDGTVAFLSQAAQNLLGVKSEAAWGKPWESLLPLAEPDQAQLKAMSKLPPAERSKLTAHVQDERGRRYWMEIEIADDPRDPHRRVFYLYDASEVYDLRRLLDEKAKFHDLIGESIKMQIVYKQIQDVAQVDSTVLIEGETGTGKELVARAIHYASPRKGKPFVAVNCAGLTESLVASQLFGHKRGAFTGAIADQVGVFEAAAGGTLFLDEIGDIPPTVQTSLLRVLQEREITRVGETRPRKVDVRVIAATHRDLNQEVAAGRFRQDLLYRIRVVHITLPALRERREDIPLLTAWFLGQFRAEKTTPVQDLSQETMHQLMNYSWPGNVRELKSAIETAIIGCKGPMIEPADLPPRILNPTLPQVPALPAEPIEDKKQRVLEILARTNGNRAAAARLLGISRSTLYLWLEELKIK